MSINGKLLAGSAELAIRGGVGTAGTLSASAATPSCGWGCLNGFSHKFGTYGSPNFVLDVFRQGARTGQPMILFRTSNTDPGEDFVLSYQGNVSDFFAAGLVSAAVELHYGGGKYLPPPFTPNPLSVDEPAFELEYAPYGVDSGL